jgi:hypothetical protein
MKPTVRDPKDAVRNMRYENKHLIFEIGPDGTCALFTHRPSRRDYRRLPPTPIARLRLAGRKSDCPAIRAVRQGDELVLQFADTSATATLRIQSEPEHFILKVLGVEGADVETLTFLDVALTAGGAPDAFVATVLSLDLQTRVDTLPGPVDHLQAACFRRFGFAGARAAVIGCPPGRLRHIMQTVVSAAPDLPHSPVGGPWALDPAENRGSYLFNFRDLTEQTVDEWIAVAKSVGFTQIDFHGSQSFRFGDCAPNPAMYPRGQASLKAVIDRLHAAGIAAGLHTYAFFIDKACPWVTPVPDPRLGKDATFTLAQALDAGAEAVPVVEPTQGMSAVTGFFERNSITLQIDAELILYSGVRSAGPYAFTGCTRGAHGTRPTAHARGTPVHHLKECFGLFAPDGDSDLLTEIAAATARTYNECGFDMMYMDALDGADLLGGVENLWHYGSKFVFEIFKRAARPPLMEMSTFYHHLWYLRSRMGAWDHPTRAYKRFIDRHVAANERNARIFLPSHLGWWATQTWSDPNREFTFEDDLEYLCGKALGTDCGFALIGLDPPSAASNAYLQRIAQTVRRYEVLRRAGYFSEAVKARLRASNQAFTLARTPRGAWCFRPTQFARHTFSSAEAAGRSWRVENPFHTQPPRVRIEALMAAVPDDARGAPTLTDGREADAFTERRSADGVAFDFAASPLRTPDGQPCLRSAARNSGLTAVEAWTMARRTFAPPLDLLRSRVGAVAQGAAQSQAPGGGSVGFGLWVHGDGQGATLNLRLRSPLAVTRALSDHYVVIDFTGWRYVEFIEQESDRVEDYRWPPDIPKAAWELEDEHTVLGRYDVYRESVDFARVESASFWFGKIPTGRNVECHMGPVHVLPLRQVRCQDPALSVGGRTVTFPVAMESGSFLEVDREDHGTLFSPEGKLLTEFKPQGLIPELVRGVNEVHCACAPTGESVRLRITLAVSGRPFGRMRRKDLIDWNLLAGEGMT